VFWDHWKANKGHHIAIWCPLFLFCWDSAPCDFLFKCAVYKYTYLLTYLYNNVSLIFKVSEDIASKSTEKCCGATVVWCTLFREPCENRTLLETRVTELHFCSWYCGSNHFSRWAPKTFWYMVHNGTSTSSNQKGVCDFQLVINSNLGPILHCFWDTATYWPKNANFPRPTLTKHLHSGWTLSNFQINLIATGLESLGYPSVKILWW